MLYRLMQTLLRTVLGVFFRRVRTAGAHHIPDEGGVIFVGNHPNSLIDPALLIAFAGRQVSFAAKDILFRSALLRPILHAVGAVPIRRAQDHGGGAVDNQAAFDALFDRLAEGGAIGIFPEGISHDEAQLQPLKTGAARIALGAAARGRVAIVPVGLNYSRADRFRSSVLLRYGEAIVLDDRWLAQASADPHAAARLLTAEIEGALRALTINADDWDTLRVLDTVRRLYQPPGLSVEARVELSRRFSEGYALAKDRPDVHALFYAVQHFRDRLDAIGLSERDLVRSWGLSDIFARFWQRTGRALLWLPLAIPGALLHLPLVLLAWVVSPRLTPRSDVIATTKLVLGAVLASAAWAAIGAWVFVQWGPVALPGLLLLPLSAWATLRVVERYASARDLALGLLGFVRFRKEVAALRRERRRLERAVLAVVTRHLPPDLEPLFLEASKARVGADAGQDLWQEDSDPDAGLVAALDGLFGAQPPVPAVEPEGQAG